MQRMSSRDFMEALMDLDNNPDFEVIANQTYYGHYVDGEGMVWTTDEEYVGTLPEEVFERRVV